jgi:hypothetical protein
MGISVPEYEFFLSQSDKYKLLYDLEAPIVLNLQGMTSAMMIMIKVKAFFAHLERQGLVSIDYYSSSFSRIKFTRVDKKVNLIYSFDRDNIEISTSFSNVDLIETLRLTGKYNNKHIVYNQRCLERIQVAVEKSKLQVKQS